MTVTTNYLVTGNGITGSTANAVQALVSGGGISGWPVATAFSANLNFRANQSMPIQVVASDVSLTIDAAGAINGAYTTVDFLSNGTNTITFDAAFREWGGSMGYDNRNGIRNTLTVFYRDTVFYYLWTQAISATAESIPTAPSFSVAPSISTAPAGVPASYSSGTYSGSPTPTVTQQWTLDGVDISGATNATYTPISGDVGRALRVRQIATNAGGSADSTSAPTTVGAAATSPGAPTIGTATGGMQSATVAFTAPASDGGSAITGYTATSSPGGFTGTLSGSGSGTITVNGLALGTPYTFTVTATNAVGTGSASAASNSATTASFVRYNSATEVGTVTESGNSSVGYTYSGPSGGFGDYFVAESTPKVPDGGWVANQYNGTATGGLIALSTSSSPVVYSNTSNKCSVWADGSLYRRLTDGTGNTSTGVVPAAGDYVRLRRSGTDVLLEKSTDGGKTWPTLIYTWAGITTAGTVLYAQMACGFQGTASNIIKPIQNGMTA